VNNKAKGLSELGERICKLLLGVTSSWTDRA